MIDAVATDHAPRGGQALGWLGARAVLIEGVRLASASLRDAPMAWFGRWLAVAMAIGYSLLAVRGQVNDAGEPGATWITAATRTAVWIVGGAVVLAASQRRRLDERAAGLEWVLYGAGATPGTLALTSALATLSLSVRYCVGAIAAVGVVVVAISPSASIAGTRALVLAACVVFSLVVLSLFSLLATAADVASPQRGRSMLYLFAILSLAFAELTGVRSLSVFHWLSNLLPALTSLVGVTEPR